MRVLRGSRSRTACTPPPQAQSSTPSSAPVDRSRWGRVPAWPRWPRARWRPPASPTPGDVATFVAGMTLISGLLFLLLAVLRMGWIAQFLSRAVVTGFLFGAAIDVVIGELPKITGTDTSGIQLVPGAGLLAGFARRDAPDDARRRGRVARRGLRNQDGRARASQERSSSSSEASSRRTCSTSATRASPSSATSRAAFRPSTSPARR